MSYPPKGAKRPIDLGAPPAAKVLYIDRCEAGAGGGGGSARGAHRALHSRVDDPPTLWALLARAAESASAATAELERLELAARRALPADAQRQLNRKTRVIDDHDRAHDHLWTMLDPPLAGKSAAVKSAAQAASLETLCFPSEAARRDAARARFGDALFEWFGLSERVARGAHQLFLAGVHGWNVGLDAQGRVVRGAAAAGGAPAVARDAWWPFEDYDRTADARYANCFGDSEAQRHRSRVAVDRSSHPDREAIAAAWAAAMRAHWRMLDLEATHGLFAPGDAACRLTPAEVGGLFLLTNVPDNCAKREELFDHHFWRLRVVHFGVERNSGLRINNFSLRPLRPRCDADRPPLRQSCPHPMRSYCWLDNALHTMVALKVLIFFRVRAHAYDAAEGKPPTPEAELAKRVRIDRHDIEQSKNHWLPALARARASATAEAAAAPAPAPAAASKKRARPDDEGPTARSPSPPRPSPPSPSSSSAAASPPRDASEGAPSLIEQLVRRAVARRADAGALPVRDALSRMATERFCLRRRIEALDKMVGMHLGAKRLLASEGARLQRAAMERLDAISARIDAGEKEEGAAGGAAALRAEFAAIASRFGIDHAHEEAVASVRRIACTDGIVWDRADRLWASDHPSARRLVDIDASVVRSNEVVRVRGAAEWAACFGEAGDAGAWGSAARCDPLAGTARREARSLADRLLGLLRRELEYREAASLDAIVALPAECRPEVSVAAAADALPPDAAELPDHVRAYAAALREETDRKRLMAAFADAAQRTMARAVHRCFCSCLRDASEEEPESDEGSDAEAEAPLRLPPRLYDARRRVAVDLVHRFLNIANAHGGLIAVDSEDDDVEGVPIVVYCRRTRRLSMPNPEAVVEHHWEAARHLVDLAARAEAWVRDHRRRVDGTVLLSAAERWVTLAAEGIRVHGPERAAAVQAELRAAAASQAERYWPTWPPREHALDSEPRLRTALVWGRHAACTALGGAKRASREYIPNEPYHNHRADAAAIGEHVWLHRADAREQGL